MQATEQVGQRELKKQEKRQRIFDAATELFARDGFRNVTMQAIARHAGVATGTIFLYAANKADLLLMVYNAGLRDSLNAALRSLPQTEDPAERIISLLTPVLTWIRGRDDNTIEYQREVLFGSLDNTNHLESLRIVRDLEREIADILRSGWSGVRHSPEAQTSEPADPTAAARTIYGTAQLEVSRAVLGGVPTPQLVRQVEQQVQTVVRGYLATPTGLTAPAGLITPTGQKPAGQHSRQ